MPLRWEILHDEKMVHVVADGTVTLKDLEEHFDALYVAAVLPYGKLTDSVIGTGIGWGLVTNTYGVLAGNTNFNIDDFTIKDLNGVGTLSFWYNTSTGQEELLLDLVGIPEINDRPDRGVGAA